MISLAPTPPYPYNHNHAERAEDRPGTRMKPLTNRKWDGILSLVWFCGGFLALKFFDFHSDSPALWFLLVFFAWWGVAMLLAVSGLRSRSWPSVVASLATILLFISFHWVAAPRGVSHRGPRALIAAAQTQIATFKTALDAFQVDTGFYPTGRDGLQALIKQPVGTTNWRGPYLSGDSLPRDPWGHEYFYECPGQHNSNSYDISSPGPPRQNTPIENWTRPGLKP
jgi:general secretion pathway protein G